jgi:hypothetical protein
MIEPARAARVARVVWTVWAVVVWNLVFDHVIVAAGREYVRAAIDAAAAGAAFLRIDDWMRPAVSRGLWIASAASAAILIVGFASVAYASRGTLPLSER